MHYTHSVVQPTARSVEDEEKNQNYSWYSAQGPGRMAQMPQAGTGDSVSRFPRSRCSTLFNYNSYFLVGGQLLLSTIICDLDSRSTAKYS